MIGCTWSVSNGTPWINILSSLNNSNSGSVTYSVEANPTALTRVGVVTIAGQEFTITQAGANCFFDLDAFSASHGAGLETNFVAVTTLIGCAWTVENSNSWITVHTPLSSTNSGVVTYSVEPNPTAIGRSTVLRIAEVNFVVTQTGAGCVFSLATNSAVHGADAETNSVAVTAVPGSWTADATNSWIIIQSPLSNTNDGSVTYRLLANPTALTRVGVVTIAGQDFTVTQGGAVCSFAIAPESAAHDFAATTGSVVVTTLVGCEWNVSNGVAWITILSSLSNTNGGSVTYSVEENTTALSRTGVVSIAGQDFAVTQSGAGCSFALATNAAVHGSALETNAVEVTTLIGCTWSVSNGAPWIEILSPLDNTSSTNVSYRVLANPDALWRTGIVSIADIEFTIAQAPANCAFELATNSATHDASAMTNSVELTTLVGCTWSVSNSTPWIHILSSLDNSNSSSVAYSVDANPTALTRAGIFTIAGHDFTVTQGGAECTFTIAPENTAHNFAATNGTVAVITLDGCEWSVLNNVPWIAILSSLSSSNSGSVNYSVAENTTALSRTGVVSIAGRDFVVTQSGASCSFALATNAAVHGAAPDTNSVEVTTLIGCTWSVSNGAPWIEILSPLDNTSSTNVSYRVLSNPDALWRTGIVSIAGVDFTVAQSPADCTFALATNSAAHDASAATNSVAVTTLVGCTWSVSNGAPWIQILSSLDNSNSSSVTTVSSRIPRR